MRILEFFPPLLTKKKKKLFHRGKEYDGHIMPSAPLDQLQFAL